MPTIETEVWAEMQALTLSKFVIVLTQLNTVVGNSCNDYVTHALSTGPDSTGDLGNNLWLNVINKICEGHYPGADVQLIRMYFFNKIHNHFQIPPF